jgi:hypothetical protein
MHTKHGLCLMEICPRLSEVSVSSQLKGVTALTDAVIDMRGFQPCVHYHSHLTSWTPKESYFLRSRLLTSETTLWFDPRLNDLFSDAD